MFNAPISRSWPEALFGAVVFGLLFAFLALAEERLFSGHFHVTNTVLGFGGFAFLGYLGVVGATRYRDRKTADAPSQTHE